MQAFFNQHLQNLQKNEKVLDIDVHLIVQYIIKRRHFMDITKDGKTYTITESRNKWTVKAENGKLSVAYDVSKELCATAEELRRYVLKSDLF